MVPKTKRKKERKRKENKIQMVNYAHTKTITKLPKSNDEVHYGKNANV